MRFLILGGAGFIGSHITDTLLEQGHEVICFDNFSSGKEENLKDKSVVHYGDLTFKKDITDFFKYFGFFDYVIHCAAQTDVRVSIDNPYMDAKQNILNTLQLLDVMEKFNVFRIIFLSSGGAIYSDAIASETSLPSPKSPYGIAKLSVENYLQFYSQVKGFDSTILRLSNVYGPRNVKGVVRLFYDCMKENQPITLNGEGKQVRDFIHVYDVVSALIHLLPHTGIFNVGTGVGTSILELKNELHHFTNTPPHEKDVIKPHIEGEALTSILDIKKIKSTGWRPTYNLRMGLTTLN